MVQFIVSLVGGAALGGTFALVGLGLVLAFRATETFNFAHGELMVFPAFLMTYLQAKWGSVSLGSFLMQVAVSLAFVAVLGVLFYVTALRRLTGRPVFLSLVATLGLAAILDGFMTITFGSKSSTLTVPGLPSGVVTIFGARISSASLVLTAFTLVLAAAVACLLRFTHLGTQVRAAGQDAVLASQGGINVPRVYMGSWALAATLAGIAGITYGAVTIVDMSMLNLAMAAVPAIMLGGLDSIEGSVVGGIAIGIVQGFTATYLGGEYQYVVTYSILLVLLLVHPQGFFGTKEVVRV